MLSAASLMLALYICIFVDHVSWKGPAAWAALGFVAVWLVDPIEGRLSLDGATKTAVVLLIWAYGGFAIGHGLKAFDLWQAKRRVERQSAQAFAASRPLPVPKPTSPLPTGRDSYIWIESAVTLGTGIVRTNFLLVEASDGSIRRASGADLQAMHDRYPRFLRLTRKTAVPDD